MRGLPGAPSGDLEGYTLIYPGRSRILHLQEFFFRLETTYCVSGTGCVVLGKTLLEIRRGIPPKSLHSPRTPAVSGCAETEHIWRDSLCPLSPPPGGRSRAGESSPPPDRSRPDRGSPSLLRTQRRSRYPGTHLEDWIGVCRSPLRQNRRGGGYPK